MNVEVGYILSLAGDTKGYIPKGLFYRLDDALNYARLAALNMDPNAQVMNQDRYIADKPNEVSYEILNFKIKGDKVLAFMIHYMPFMKLTFIPGVEQTKEQPQKMTKEKLDEMRKEMLKKR